MAILEVLITAFAVWWAGTEVVAYFQRQAISRANNRATKEEKS